jgi:glycosyltransferase involved in cell wall biosynthesis
MMTGIPIVAVGPKWGNSMDIAGDMYEIPDIIQNGVNGFWSDDINELRERVKMLVENKHEAARIGSMGRQTAIDLFGKEFIKNLWKAYIYGDLKSAS